MKCRRVEELLPLLVEGDLGHRNSHRMAKHLEDCPSCRDLAAEYRESQSWLRTSRQLDFDESVFDGLRRQVLSQIREDRSATAVRGGRFIPALGVALLVIVIGMAFYFSQHDRQSLEESSPEYAQEPWETPTGKVENVVKAPVPKQASRIGKRHRPVSHAAMRSDLPSATYRDLGDVAHEMSPFRDYHHFFPLRPHTLRIEIQTSDPNIRIIWFARIPSKPETEAQ